MMCSSQRASCQFVLVCLLLLCLAPSSLAFNSAEQTAAEAQNLLTLSAKQNLRNHSLALETARKALNLWTTLGDRAGVATALASIGRYQLALGNLVDAKKSYEQALESWRRQNDLLEQADTLIMLGYIEAKKGEWPSAVSYYGQAQALLKDKNYPIELGQIAAGFADFFIENGMLDGAVTQYQRALDYYRQTDHTRAINRTGTYRSLPCR